MQAHTLTRARARTHTHKQTLQELLADLKLKKKYEVLAVLLRRAWEINGLTGRHIKNAFKATILVYGWPKSQHVILVHNGVEYAFEKS